MLNIAQRLIQSWFSGGKKALAKRPHLIWEREAEPVDRYFRVGGARHEWNGNWTDRSRYPGVILRAIRQAAYYSGRVIGVQYQMSIGAA